MLWNCGVGENSWGSLGQSKGSNQSILKEISPEYSLEGLMLKLKLQHFGHLMQKTDSLEKTLMLGKIEGRRRRRGWDGWMASPTRWTWVWVSSMVWWWTGKPGVRQSMGLQRTRRNWATVTCTHTQTHVMPAECSLEGLMLKLKLQHFGHLMWRTNLLEKTLIAGKDWRWEEKGMTEDEMVGWHHQLDGHEFEQAPGVDDGQGSLACCSPWGHKELDMTKWLNWTECIKCFKESCPLWFSALS